MCSVLIFVLNELYNDVNNVEKSSKKNVHACDEHLIEGVFYVLHFSF
jgi:hypothetical protein